MSGPRIALIHATPVAIEPIVSAFRRLWQEARAILLVTAADAVAVMDSYAVVKTMHTRKVLRQAPALAKS